MNEPAVNVDWDNDESGTNDELSWQRGVEQKHRDAAREQYGRRSRKAFQNIVRIFDDNGDNNTAKRLQENVNPDDSIVTIPETIARYLKFRKHMKRFWRIDKLVKFVFPSSSFLLEIRASFKCST